MPTEYESLLHRWFDEVWNKKNSSVIRELLAPDAKVHGVTAPGSPPVIGPDAFEKYHAEFLQAFPGVHVDLDQVVDSGDKIAGRFTVTGIQEGDLPGMPATGKKVEFTGSGVATIADGKFTEVWNDIDFLKMQYDLAPDTPDVE